MESETAYSLLHVPRTASSDEILYAYRKESLKYHPRRFDPGEKFIEIHFKKLADAYETLIDPQKRQEYDKRLKEKEKKAIKNPDCSKLFDPDSERQVERQRRQSVPTRPSTSAGHHPPTGTRNLLSQAYPTARATQPIPIPQPPGSSSASRVTEPRARRSSISGLAPIPNLGQLQQMKPQTGIPPSSSHPKPFITPSSIQPPARAGSCVPALETSGFKQNTSRLDESLLSMRLNQYPNAHRSQPSNGQKARINRQSIINELNNRARSNSSATTKLPYPMSTTSSSSTCSISPSSSFSPSSFSPRQPSKFSLSPSSAAPLSRMSYSPSPDLSAQFNPPRHLLSSAQHSFEPPNDQEYQPLLVNPSSQNQAHKRSPHPPSSSAYAASQLYTQRRDVNY
ncbi:hypothetical protein VP01_1276g9 [Puccinia sorghi]|uniref:J domain-containing protein n=1 Tax=Puccinia sorghi TaxID=27349 RepID=A0A0L6VP46_9BASI|nr:hypothetical protein VP01_1276g9 [Puccinia sorghi]